MMVVLLVYNICLLLCLYTQTDLFVGIFCDTTIWPVFTFTGKRQTQLFDQKCYQCEKSSLLLFLCRVVNKTLRENEVCEGREGERDVILAQSIALHHPAVVTLYSFILQALK